jgi:acetamidase/formamidase
MTIRCLAALLSAVVWASAVAADAGREELRQVPARNFPGATHLLPATPETVQWGWFDNAEPPVLTVRSGDTVVMETMMHSHNQIVPGVSIDEIKALRVNNPGRGPHSVTGPVYVEGARPGDVLKVHIQRIVPRAYGANFNLPGMLGQFPDQFADGKVRYFYLDWTRKVTEFAPGIEIPLAPFPGILGVARAEAGKYSTVPPGPYGGNMDLRELVEGTTAYLPVFVDGALLWSGDSHAAQGNGEVNLTAVETAFKELALTVEVLKGKSLAWPRVETPKHWITMGADPDLNRALDILRAETIKLLVEMRGASHLEAEAWMRRFSDCRVAEVVNQSKLVYCMNGKALEAKPVWRPVEDTARSFVTAAADPDLQKAMNEASMSMIRKLGERKQLSPLDAYSLASVAMDCQLGDITAELKRVHCLLPKSLWQAARDRSAR